MATVTVVECPVGLLGMPRDFTGDAQRFYWGCPEILLGAQRFYWGCPEKLLGMSHTVHTGFRMACNHDGLTS